MIPAVVNIRESAIVTMASRGQLDAAQVAAADRFRALFEAMGGKGAGAIDYSREYVRLQQLGSLRRALSSC